MEIHSITGENLGFRGTRGKERHKSQFTPLHIQARDETFNFPVREKNNTIYFAAVSISDLIFFIQNFIELIMQLMHRFPCFSRDNRTEIFG